MRWEGDFSSVSKWRDNNGMGVRKLFGEGDGNILMCGWIGRGIGGNLGEDKIRCGWR